MCVSFTSVFHPKKRQFVSFSSWFSRSLGFVLPHSTQWHWLRFLSNIVIVEYVLSSIPLFRQFSSSKQRRPASNNSTKLVVYLKVSHFKKVLCPFEFISYLSFCFRPFLRLVPVHHSLFFFSSCLENNFKSIFNIMKTQECTSSASAFMKYSLLKITFSKRSPWHF